MFLDTCGLLISHQSAECEKCLLVKAVCQDHLLFVGMKAGGIKGSGGSPVCTKALSCEIIFYLETKAKNSFWLGFGVYQWVKESGET